MKVGPNGKIYHRNIFDVAKECQEVLDRITDKLVESKNKNPDNWIINKDYTRAD